MRVGVTEALRRLLLLRELLAVMLTRAEGLGLRGCEIELRDVRQREQILHRGVERVENGLHLRGHALQRHSQHGGMRARMVGTRCTLRDARHTVHVTRCTFIRCA